VVDLPSDFLASVDDWDLPFGGVVGTPNRPLTTYDICDGSGVVGVVTEETEDDSLEELDTLPLLCVASSPRKSDCRREVLSSDLLGR